MKIDHANSGEQPERSLRGKGIGYDTGFSFDALPADHSTTRSSGVSCRSSVTTCTVLRCACSAMIWISSSLPHATPPIWVWRSGSHRSPTSLVPRRCSSCSPTVPRSRGRVCHRRRTESVQQRVSARQQPRGADPHLLQRQPETLQMLAGLPARINGLSCQGRRCGPRAVRRSSYLRLHPA